MRALLCAILCVFFICQPTLANDIIAVEELIKNKLDAVILVLQEKELSADEKNNRINEIVSPLFAFQQMAKLSLGRKYWPSLSNEEKERFMELFIERMKNSYREKLTLYTDEEIIYEEPSMVKNKLRYQTYLISKDNKISILYKLYKAGDIWKIYDVEVEGVSIIQTYRSQFHQVLQNGTINDLLQKMQEPVDS